MPKFCLIYACLTVGLTASLLGCGPKLPARYVIESDIDGYAYRRYQQVLDVELPIEGNAAVGHTATYVRGGSTVRVAPVFVTTYERAAGLTETVRQRLRGMDDYSLDVAKVSGEYLWRMRGQAGDLWVVWVSDRHLAKVGAPEGEAEVPPELIEAYLDLYPSDLDAQGHAREGRSSAGAAAVEAGGEAPSKQP
jgi:hypothetical protein